MYPFISNYQTIAANSYGIARFPCDSTSLLYLTVLLLLLLLLLPRHWLVKAGCFLKKILKEEVVMLDKSTNPVICIAHKRRNSCHEMCIESQKCVKMSLRPGRKTGGDGAIWGKGCFLALRGMDAPGYHSHDRKFSKDNLGTAVVRIKKSRPSTFFS